MYNYDMKKVTGMRLTELYGAWLTSLDLKYRNLYATLEAKGFTETEPLTEMGGENRRPVFSADGRYIFLRKATASATAGCGRSTWSGARSRPGR